MHPATYLILLLQQTQESFDAIVSDAKLINIDCHLILREEEIGQCLQFFKKLVEDLSGREGKLEVLYLFEGIDEVRSKLPVELLLVLEDLLGVLVSRVQRFLKKFSYIIELLVPQGLFKVAS